MAKTPSHPLRRAHLAGRWGLGMLLVGGIILSFIYRDAMNAEAVRRLVDSLGFWAGPGFVGVYAVAALLLVPCFPLTLASGAIFGPVLGTILNLTGATLGAMAGFKASRYLVGDWVRSSASGRLETIVSGVESRGWQYVAFTRLVPVFPYILLNYAFGVTRIRWTRYVVTSFVAMIPAAAICAIAGYAGRRLLFALKGPWAFVATGVGVAASVAVGWWWQCESG